MAKQGFDFKAWTDKLQELDVNDLNEIDWEDMGSWPMPGKVVFCSLIFIAVVIGGYFLLVKDSVEHLERETAKEVQLRKKLIVLPTWMPIRINWQKCATALARC